MFANNSSTAIRFWYTVAEPDASDNLQQLLQLPHAQQQYYTSLRHPHRRQEYLSSRLLICTALSNLFDQPLHYWKIEERSNSAPLIHNLPIPGYISLTHSKGLICFALSADRIGIDAEYKKSSKDFTAAAELFMSASEQASMPDSLTERQHYFYRLWCAKEAFYKALPTTEQAQTTLISLPYADLKSTAGQWYLHEAELDHYHIAVISRSDIDTDSFYMQQLRC